MLHQFYVQLILPLTSSLWLRSFLFPLEQQQFQLSFLATLRRKCHTLDIICGRAKLKELPTSNLFQSAFQTLEGFHDHFHVHPNLNLERLYVQDEELAAFRCCSKPRHIDIDISIEEEKRMIHRLRELYPPNALPPVKELGFCIQKFRQGPVLTEYIHEYGPTENFNSSPNPNLIFMTWMDLIVPLFDDHKSSESASFPSSQEALENIMTIENKTTEERVKGTYRVMHEQVTKKRKEPETKTSTKRLLEKVHFYSPKSNLTRIEFVPDKDLVGTRSIIQITIHAADLTTIYGPFPPKTFALHFQTG